MFKKSIIGNLISQTFLSHCRRNFVETATIKRTFSRSAENRTESKSLVYTKLNSRSVIRLKGEEVIKFLQGLVTNDVRYFENTAEHIQLNALYSFILNTQGRVLYDVLLYHKEKNGEILIECDSKLAAEVKKTLVMYKLRKKIEIDSVDDQLNVFCIFEKGFEISSETDHTAPLNLNMASTFSCLDPRVSLMGYRVLLRADQQPNVVFNKIEEVPEAIYHSKRYSLGVGEGATDLPVGNCFPLESNGDYLNGISFHKGCYVGQELTARTHHTGVVRKRLMPILFETKTSSKNTDLMENFNKIRQNKEKSSKSRISAQEPISTTTDSGGLPSSSEAKVLNEKSENMGKFRNACGNFGLALLRVEESLKSEKLFVKMPEDVSIQCKTFKPHWWGDKNSNVLGEIHGFNPNAVSTA